jgi:Ca2+-binding RTX toxin-like protein
LRGIKGNDDLYGLQGNDTLDGGIGDDRLYGGDNNDTLIGWTGNDVLYGEDWHDSLNGGSGNDSLSGGEGDDVLVGEGGDDYLSGDGGKDILNGGAGNDNFYYYDTSESYVGQSYRDVIQDFTRGDKINLAQIDSDYLNSNDQDFAFIGTGPLTGGSAVRYFITGNDIMVQVEIAGDGDILPDMEIQLLGAAARLGSLTADDFYL